MRVRAPRSMEHCSSGEVEDHVCIPARVCCVDSRDAHPRTEDPQGSAAPRRHMPRIEYAARRASRQIAEVDHRRAALIAVTRCGRSAIAAQKNRTACTVRPESRWRREGDLGRAYFLRYLAGGAFLDPSRDQRAFLAGAAASLAALRLLRVRSPNCSAVFCAMPRISWPVA